MHLENDQRITKEDKLEFSVFRYGQARVVPCRATGQQAPDSLDLEILNDFGLHEGHKDQQRWRILTLDGKVP